MRILILAVSLLGLAARADAAPAIVIEPDRPAKARPQTPHDSPFDASAESQVKVPAKGSEPRGAQQPSEPTSLPNSWLSMAGIALSIVALIIALTRKR